MTRKQLNGALKQAGLAEFAEADFLFRPALELLAAADNDKRLPIGVSKFGGHPDLPARWEWPCVKRRPISFVAQVNLSEASRAWPSIPLPRAGVLSFFYDAAEQPWGSDGKIPKGSLKVAFFRPAKLIRTPPPVSLEPEFIFRPKRLGFRNTISMGSTADMDCEDLRPEQLWNFNAFYVSAAYSDRTLTNQLLGYGYALQASPSWSCPRRDYELLLQLTSGQYNGPGEMMWGDDGVIQFMMSPRDLAQQKFDKAHVVLQCF